MGTDDQVIVLRDTDGNTYVLPWDVVVAAKVPLEHVEDVEDVLVDDVSGFSVSPAFFNGRILSASDFSQEQSAVRRRPTFDLSAHLSHVRSKHPPWPP